MESLLELKNVSKVFTLGRKNENIALCQLNLAVKEGEILGIVGESGSGKSTLARVIMGVYPPTKGQVYYRGQELKLSRHSQRKAFAKRAQMIFQDPYLSLDPYLTAADIISENLEIHLGLEKAARKKRIYELMEMTGLSQDMANRYPHQFSGGQRQRIGIARALAVQPELIICDEPLSALDISVRSQIINLLIDLKKSSGLTYLFISHDLSMIRYFSDRIAVMYAGQLVELGAAREISEMPHHPYTRMLLRAVLNPVPETGRLNSDTDIDGETQVIWEQQSGCPFVSRCRQATARCITQKPELKELSAGHFTACHV